MIKTIKMPLNAPLPIEILILRLNYKTALKTLFSMPEIDLYDFLADTGADPWGQPGEDTREGLIDFAIAHIDKNGPEILMNYIYQGESNEK